MRRPEPGPSPWDLGNDAPVLRGCGPTLRRVIHEQLGLDLQHRAVSAVKIDFSRAQPTGRVLEAHGGRFPEVKGVDVLDASGRVVFSGEVTFLYDPMAEFLRVFFGPTLPQDVWEEADLGVRRRLRDDPRWKDDIRVKSGGVGHEDFRPER